jgi:hypothetical protein
MYTKWPEPIPNDHKIPTFSIPIPYKIYPNWDLGFENIPSGNPGETADPGSFGLSFI